LVDDTSIMILALTCNRGFRVWKIVVSCSCQVNPKTIKFIFVTSPRSMQD